MTNEREVRGELHQADAWLRSEHQAGRRLLQAGGRWGIGQVGRLNAQLQGLEVTSGEVIQVDASEIIVMDTAGAWVLHRTLKRLRGQGLKVEIANAKPAVAEMLEEVARNDNPCEIAPPSGNAIANCIALIGESAVDIALETAQLISFLGSIFATLGRTVVNPRRLRLVPLVHHMQQVGLNALPIVCLISFLIGVVLAYQGASQLQKFGAEIFVVNLIAISLLREIGILLTAIVIAGRSGSAFTAQIGSMKVNEEIDAMRTLGLDPMEVLVLPRVLALVITLPLLAFFSDIVGLFGGALMAWVTLDISPGLFLERLHATLGPWTFWIGIIKAPVFAFIIAMLGCFEGFQVVGSSESVGQKTTRAVVEAIFLVIVVDAIFSIFFAFIGI
jgi:phospholipid/cholesterol/gamma-HCH transport system permease protein